MKKFISVNKHRIVHNLKHGTRTPVVRVQLGKSGQAIYGHKAVIFGPSTLTYDPDGPILKCGARVVLETEAPVNVMDAESKTVEMIP